MPYKLLSRSGLRISGPCPGTMAFGADRGWEASPEGSRRIFEADAPAGGTFIDTADLHTNGTRA